MSAGPRRWQFEFSEPGLTHFGGMVLIQRFVRRSACVGSCSEMCRRVCGHRILARGFAPGLALRRDFGLRRINKTEILQYNGHSSICWAWIAFLINPGCDDFLKPFRQRYSPTGSLA